VESQKTPVGIFALLVVSAALWGGAWPSGKVLAGSYPPASVIVFRYIIVVICFFTWLKLEKHPYGRPRRRDFGPLAMMAVTSVTAYQLFFMFGLRYTAASDASLVIAFNPTITAVLSVWILKDKMSWKRVGGLVLGVGGVALITGFSPNTSIPVDERLLGDGLVFGGAIAYATYTVVLRKYLQRDAEERLSVVGILAWISLIGAVLLVPVAVIEQPWTHHWGTVAWLNIAYLAIGSTVMGYALYAFGVERIGAARAAIFVNLVPVFGVLLSFGLLGEALGLTHLLSFVLIYLGVILVNRS